MNIHSLPFRLGTSSYIIPADILPNAHYLAGKVRDIELILFEVDDEQNNLPSPEVIDELINLAALYDLTYTVHLPLDLKLGADGSEQAEVANIADNPAGAPDVVNGGFPFPGDARYSFKDTFL